MQRIVAVLRDSRVARGIFEARHVENMTPKMGQHGKITDPSQQREGFEGWTSAAILPGDRRFPMRWADVS